MDSDFNVKVNEHENAVVVYDEEGVIHHVHQVVMLGDASDDRGAEEIEAKALEVAEQFGHDVAGFKTLTVKADQLKGETRMRVDTSKMDLVPDDRAE